MSAVARRILLVEDNRGDADFVREMLADRGDRIHDVTHVTSLAGALQLLGEHDYEVVLLDLFLPDGAGVDCVRAVRARVRETPIVILTGMEDHALALRCLAAGAQDYLPKHEIRAEGLHRAIQYAVARASEAAERQRADSLQRHLAAIVEASIDGIVSMTPRGVVTSWNGGAERIFGHSSAEAMGRSFQELVVLPGELDHAPIAAAGGTEPRDLTGSRKDGTTITVSVVACNLYDALGNIAAVAAICRDVTGSRRRDEELRSQTAELIARDRQMRALAARLNAVREEERTRISREVHDELGQLLTGLKMDLRWVSRHLDDRSPTELLARRIEEADQLVDRTIDGVQRIAVELRPSALDALGFAAAARDEARRFQKRTGVRMELRVDDVDALPRSVSTGFFRIFQEILTNVARHAAATVVHIDFARHGQEWILRVTDDGVGIGDEAARAPSLGLLGMRERAGEMGGAIDLARGPRGGTIVTLRVPTGEASP